MGSQDAGGPKSEGLQVKRLALCGVGWLLHREPAAADITKRTVIGSLYCIFVGTDLRLL